MTLKPCPWCGGKAELSEDHNNMPRWVWCPACEADGPPIPYDFEGTAEEALRIVTDKWNTRVVDAENERLRDAIRGVLEWHDRDGSVGGLVDPIDKCRKAMREEA